MCSDLLTSKDSGKHKYIFIKYTFMTDIFSKRKRSALMASVKSKNTDIELKLIKELKFRGIKGFELHADMIGRPDIVFKNQKLAIFCDGDYWHGYGFAERKSKMKRFWLNKINGNLLRDKQINKELRNAHWKVLRFWGHEIKNDSALCVTKIEKSL